MDVWSANFESINTVEHSADLTQDSHPFCSAPHHAKIKTCGLKKKEHWRNLNTKHTYATEHIRRAQALCLRYFRPSLHCANDAVSPSKLVFVEAALVDRLHKLTLIAIGSFRVEAFYQHIVIFQRSEKSVEKIFSQHIAKISLTRMFEKQENLSILHDDSRILDLLACHGFWSFHSLFFASEKEKRSTKSAARKVSITLHYYVKYYCEINRFKFLKRTKIRCFSNGWWARTIVNWSQILHTLV